MAVSSAKKIYSEEIQKYAHSIQKENVIKEEESKFEQDSVSKHSNVSITHINIK